MWTRSLKGEAVQGLSSQESKGSSSKTCKLSRVLTGEPETGSGHKISKNRGARSQGPTEDAVRWGYGWETLNSGSPKG